MTKKEIEKDLIDICNRNNKENAIELIEEKYRGCAVTLSYHYSKDRLSKMFMGMFLWKNFDISF